MWTKPCVHPWVIPIIFINHFGDVIMSAMAFQITSLTLVYSTVYSGADNKKTSKLRVTGLCEGNSPVTGEFPAQRASNAENVSIWWRHFDIYLMLFQWSVCAKKEIYFEILKVFNFFKSDLGPLFVYIMSCDAHGGIRVSFWQNA